MIILLKLPLTEEIVPAEPVALNIPDILPLALLDMIILPAFGSNLFYEVWPGNKKST